MDPKTPFKYEVGERIYRFGSLARIVKRYVSPLGLPVYDIEMIYQGNVETVTAMQAELSRSRP